MRRAPAQLRLQFKRTFSLYYLDLCSSGIADPTEAYESCAAYLSVRRGLVGEELFQLEAQEELTRLEGEIEQDLRLRGPTAAECLAQELLPERLRECFDWALKRLED
jgi:hypothetical protein